jgi:uncharacterized membrane protein YoaK (UPF0700 family)
MLVMTSMNGVVDAVSILSLGHVFLANMTGNLLFIGLALGGAPGFSLSTSLVALGGFGAGVILCRTLIASRPVIRRLILRDAMAVEVAFLAAALVLALVSRPSPPLGPRDVMVGVCAIAFGVQNGVVHRLGVPDLTTSVMTRTLVGLLWDAGGRQEVTVRQFSSVASLVVGAILGATLVTQVGRAAPARPGCHLGRRHCVMVRLGRHPTAHLDVVCPPLLSGALGLAVGVTDFPRSSTLRVAHRNPCRILDVLDNIDFLGPPQGRGDAAADLRGTTGSVPDPRDHRSTRHKPQACWTW